MPIHVLKVEKKETGDYDFSKVFKWADEFVRGRVYVVIVTDEHEVILEPRKSTRPLDFGYVKLDSAEGAEKLAQELENKYTIKRIEETSLAWDTEKPPWVKIPVE